MRMRLTREPRTGSLRQIRWFGSLLGPLLSGTSVGAWAAAAVATNTALAQINLNMFPPLSAFLGGVPLDVHRFAESS
jgi:hypothetical protein